MTRRYTAIATLTGALACITVSCGNGGSGTADPTTAAAQISVTFRPVLACNSDGSMHATAPSGNPANAAGMTVLAFGDGDFCQLGPTTVTGAAFAGDANADDASGQWAVLVTIRDGANGLDLVNQLAAKCFAREKACPTGDAAFVIDGMIITKATVQTASFDSGTLQIAGDFNEAQARAIAEALNLSA